MGEEDPSTKEGQSESGMFQTAPGELRDRAQREAGAGRARVPEDLLSLSPEAARNVLHELRVHQIELELQNDELRRTQLELEESRGRYFELYDLAPVGYLTISEKGLIEQANLMLGGLLGVARSALIKQPWSRFIASEDQDVYFKHRAQLYANGAPRGCELRLIRSNGDAFWVRLEARIADGEDGARLARTVLSDITERKRAEEILKASEARHRILFERSADALMTLTPGDWLFSSGNAATLALFDAHDETDFIARTLWHYSAEFQPDGRRSGEKGPAMLALALKHGAHTFEWSFLRASGEEFRASISLTRVEVAGALLLQATVRDETAAEWRRASAAQTERLASMGMLAASVGHEINNPLAYVLSNVENLAEVLPRLTRAVEHSQAELRSAVGGVGYAAAIGEHAELLEPSALQTASEQASEALAGTRRIALISKVLNTFSRAGAQQVAEVDLQYAVECALTLVSNQIRFRAKLVTDFRPLPRVSAPEGKLSQVFVNLLLNAAQSIEEGDANNNCITVRTWAEGGNVFGEVKDTGQGMSVATRTRAFEPFFTTKPLGRGSGLGLSICKGVVAECGGDIQVESELGGGSRFLVRLPAAPAQPEAGDSARPLAAPQPFVRGRVLVIDDEAPLLKLMKRLLKGHDVVTVSSGREAQQVLEKDKDFDLILCDLMMPERNGVEVHKWLVTTNAALAARLVFTTGGAFGDATTRYLAECGAPRLAKPFDALEFRRVVLERIQLAKQDPAPSASKA